MKNQKQINTSIPPLLAYVEGGLLRFDVEQLGTEYRYRCLRVRKGMSFDDIFSKIIHSHDGYDPEKAEVLAHCACGDYTVNSLKKMKVEDIEVIGNCLSLPLIHPDFAGMKKGRKIQKILGRIGHGYLF